MSKLNHMLYSEIRIIGGSWRGRKIRFPCLNDLRPTPNRVRETLFNWLAPIVQGSRCLDLFAGSGALGFEALSRGAKEVVFIDESELIVKQLQDNAAKLNSDNAIIKQAKINDNLLMDLAPFDVVFLDPPFKQNLLTMCIDWLERQHLLSANSHIYIETNKQLTAYNLPQSWVVIREKKAGQVYYYLIERNE